MVLKRWESTVRECIITAKNLINGTIPGGNKVQV